MFRFGDPGGRMYQVMGASNANFLAHWTAVTINAGTSIAIAAGGGRLTGSCLRFGNGSATASPVYATKTLAGTPQPTWGMAFAFKASAAPSGTGTVIADFNDAGTWQVDLRLLSDMNLVITRNGSPLGNGNSPLSAGAWNHIEWKATIHPTAGAAALWINGVQKINLTNINTRNTANSFANGIHLGMVNQANVASLLWDYDDFIVYDGQANDANGLADITGPIGDSTLHWLLPTAAGTTTQWAPDSGSNYARASEAQPDGDTSYVGSATAGQLDTYGLANLPANVTTVKSVAACHYAKKMDATARTLAASLRSGGTNYDHATAMAPSTSYVYGFSNWGLNPKTAAAWTPADVNALELGQKLVT